MRPSRSTIPVLCLLMLLAPACGASEGPAATGGAGAPPLDVRFDSGPWSVRLQMPAGGSVDRIVGEFAYDDRRLHCTGTLSSPDIARHPQLLYLTEQLSTGACYPGCTLAFDTRFDMMYRDCPGRSQMRLRVALPPAAKSELVAAVTQGRQALARTPALEGHRMLSEEEILQAIRETPDYRSAIAGNVDMQIQLGLRLIAYPMDVARHRMGLDLLRRAASSGSVRAMLETGQCYTTGFCGEKFDYPQAIEWYSRAAAKGSSTAMYNVAVIYRDGDKANGFPANAALAKTWFRKAAAAGDADAQKELRRDPAKEAADAADAAARERQADRERCIASAQQHAAELNARLNSSHLHTADTAWCFQ